MIDSSLDAELRAATFAFVASLRARFGGRIPSTELRAGIQFQGERVPIWSHMKGIHKPKIFGVDGAALSIQTSHNSPYDDTQDVDAGQFVYKFRGDDPEQSDNRALLRAMERQSPLLYLFAVDRGGYDAIFPVYIADVSVRDLQVTLIADQYGLKKEVVEASMVEARRRYATRAVLERLHQDGFRRVVLRAYRDRCAICQLGHLDLLDAAHILSDRHPKGEPVVTNGLGLCKIHHSAYDANILGIDPDARVHIRQDILTEIDGPMLRYGLQEMNGSSLILPTSVQSRPNRDFLAERFEAFRAA